MRFDNLIDRRGTHSAKWDMMEPMFGVSPRTGIPMWVADMEFAPPASVQRAVEKQAQLGVYGYFGDDGAYLDAIQWWMQTRHGWTPERAAIFSTHGLVNGGGICIDAFTNPGDGIILTTPVYHAFARIIKAAGREVVECQLTNTDGRYEMDFDVWNTQMTGREKMLILCSPHNPGGRCWTMEELRSLAAFCRRHDLILISDEIHCDLIYPGQRHIPMTVAAPEIMDRLIMMTATTKTFNIAGAHTGNVIIPDGVLRARFAARMMALGISPNSFGMHMATAAYSPEGAEWVDALMKYLDGNREIFDAGMSKIPGVRPMRLEATYLEWVDFTGTGMAPKEFTRRVEKDAEIAVNHGESFGAGGESFLRFNIAAPRSMVAEAVERLQRAFGDLQ
ncbi:MAG: aminotransferase [Cereibacter sphaeroides]|uniref:cysteine-S-conjugate beta-lyase n=1 Tax=Cereibacter sphaeroides TaxID=1063 RepID=A0A2W5SE12_CERSP|nr:MAG: aminotransferase [Cereibacter sphaeroides]